MLLPHRARSASAKPNCICQRCEAMNGPCLPIPKCKCMPVKLRHWVQAAIGLPSYSAADEYFQITPLALLASQTSQNYDEFLCWNMSKHPDQLTRISNLHLKWFFQTNVFGCFCGMRPPKIPEIRNTKNLLNLKRNFFRGYIECRTHQGLHPLFVKVINSRLCGQVPLTKLMSNLQLRSASVCF